MSLIICPECQHEVSSKAPNCPNCGVAIADNIKRCPVCNTYVLMGAKQCPNCKTKFVVNNMPNPQDAPNQQDAADTELDELTDEQEVASASNAQPAASHAQTADLDPQASTPAVPKKKGSSAPWWLLVLSILVLAIGAFFYWENLNQEKVEEQAYQLLESCNNPLNFEDFIARFPNSPHIEKVRTRLQELRREDAMWLEISSKADVQQLQEFVEQHPQSPYKKAALQKIDSMDWLAASKSDTRRAYESYIQKHDNGEFLNEAYAALEAARARENRARRDSIAAAADSLAEAGTR